jgi:23S rRNA (cytidine1920-2'-O)/16S rRNA (cytidine1409-2'-O)-methyltransferase
MAGLVSVDGKKQTKAGFSVPQGAGIQVLGDAVPFVSRGGLKLAKALEVFDVSPRGRTAIDIGASTGGFTDCLLKSGAVKVYAVDVGYGQLAWSLRQDPRVVVMERTNIRYLDPAVLTEKPDLGTVDTSFISVRKFLPHVLSLLNKPADLIILVKPQFEADRKSVGKKGVIRDSGVHRSVIADVVASAKGLGAVPVGLSFSPVLGPEGNIEFLLHLRVVTDAADVDSGQVIGATQIDEVVAAAHAGLVKDKESPSV